MSEKSGANTLASMADVVEDAAERRQGFYRQLALGWLMGDPVNRFFFSTAHCDPIN